MKKRLLSTALIAILGVGVMTSAVACDDEESGATITITNKDELTADWHIGESYRTVSLTTDPVTNVTSAIGSGDIVLSSSDDSIISVVGLNIYAVSEGDATITATWGKASDSVDITVLGQVFYEMPYTVGEQYYYGFLVGDEYWYMDGGTQSEGNYRGSITASLAEAAVVTLSEASDGGYYLTFSDSGTTKYICIEVVGSYVDLQYETKAVPVYWNREIGAFGNEEGTYFLCYNATYKCSYASLISSYGPYSSNPSPIATLYGLDEAIETIPWECPEEEAQYITEEPTNGGTYHLGLYNDYSADMYGTYYFTGSISSNYGATDKDVSNAVAVTVTPVSGGSGYNLSIGSESDLKYIALVKKENTSSTGSYYYNFDLVDSLATGEESNPTYTTFTWDSTYYTMVVNGVDITENNQTGTTYFMGTYSNHTTFGMSKYSYLGGANQYPGRLYEISTSF